MSEEREVGPPHLARGWYAVGMTRYLRRDRLVRARLHGRDVVVARTASGRLVALDAYCPHLGAHIGYGGSVVGETVRCPFHGLRFDCSGRCVATEYGRPPPRLARIATWEVRDVSGVLMVWADPDGGPPGWEIPPVDVAGWAPWSVTRTIIRAHPQETTENSVDTGHFAAVHRYGDVRQTARLMTDGPHLTIAYRVTRQRAVVGFKLPAFYVTYDIDAWGLGWSHVDAEVRQLGLHFRVLVLASQVDGETVDLWLASSMPRHRWARGQRTRGPQRSWPGLVSPIVAPFINYGYRADVRQDHRIWRHKRYVAHPVLASGDGPIAPYRRWARQFYPVAGAGQQTATSHRTQRRTATSTGADDALPPRPATAEATPG